VLCAALHLSHAPDSLEHKRAKRMRDIIMPLMIFIPLGAYYNLY
jgi:hypothetical protein